MRANSNAQEKFPIWPVLEFFGWDLPAPRGGWQSIKCEKHGDKHNSASISEEAQFIFCHACGFQGDAIDIVTTYEGIGFKDAVKRCEQITGSTAGSFSHSGGDAGGRGGRDKRSGRSYKPPRLRR